MARKNDASTSRSTSPAPPRNRAGLAPWLVGLAVVLAVGFAYGDLFDSQVEFARIDDGTYVVENPHVTGGLTPENVYWAFTTFHASNWHPLTWLSLQLDADLFGLDPAGFHLTNALLHAANAVLLFVVLWRATHRLWPSAFVAALFAVHPLHVESVAWITERKDVLSTLFALLTVAAYLWYIRRPTVPRYLIMAATFALGLMAKQMLVTLPFVLLLLDFWPLRRLDWAADPKPPLRRLILEKLPLLALAAGAAVLTAKAQLRDDALLPPDSLPFRTVNACLAYVAYLQKTVWPSNLAPMYTRPPGQLPVAAGIGAGMALLAVTLAVLSQVRRRPYLAVGWFWFLGTAVPVIGLVPVGIQTMADRYTYVPNIGLYIAVVWGLTDALAGRLPRRVLAGVAGLVLAVLLLTTQFYAQLWRNNVTLWEHAIQVTNDNFGAHENLGIALMAKQRTDEGIAHLRTAIQMEPRYAAGYYALGLALEERQQWAEAEICYAEAIRLAPRMIGPHFQLGYCRLRLGRMADAVDPLTVAVQRQPQVALGHYNLATALMNCGRMEEAVTEANEALAIDPTLLKAHKVLGMAFAAIQKASDAEAHFRSIAGPPLNDPAGAYFMAWSLHARGRAEAAREQFQLAARRFPGWPAASRKEAWGLATHPDPQHRCGPLALLRAQTISQALEERDADALDTLAAALAECGRFDDAAATASRAVSAARSADRADFAAEIEKRLRRYESRQPYRDASLAKATTG